MYSFSDETLDNIILERIERYNFQKKTFQVEAVRNILKAFLIEEKPYVVLSAGTGAGKSIIGTLVADILGSFETDNKLKSFALMHTNTLVSQYENFFKNNIGLKVIKGAENYSCEVLNDTAENCIYDYLNKNGLMKETCENCKYKQSRKYQAEEPFVATNYSYFFIAKIFGKFLEQRLVTIYDEAHELNEIFCNTYVIHISEGKAIAFIKEINLYHDKEINSDLRMSLRSTKTLVENLDFDSLSEDNYKNFLTSLKTIYSNLRNYFDAKAQAHLQRQEFKEYIEFKKIFQKYKGLCCKISHLFDHNFDHVVDIKDRELTVKSIFIGEMFPVIANSKYHLFMSATINEDFLQTILKIKSSKIKMIDVAPVFPPDNKRVIFFSGYKLNYETQKDPKVIKSINEICEDVIKNFSDKKGIIQTPSFYLNEEIGKYLSAKLSKSFNLVIQDKKVNLEKSLEKFKNYEGASILISPSLFEGVDLPNDLCRYQILIKAPYPSLTDKRMKYIVDKFPGYYHQLTMFKIYQAFGRSVRNETDYSNIYCIDSNIKKLYNSGTDNLKNTCKVIQL